MSDIDDQESRSVPSLTFELEIDSARQDELGTAPRVHDTLKAQILSEGKRFDSRFRARLHRVSYGSFRDREACLLLVQIDFIPKNEGMLRFRNATIGASFGDAEGLSAQDIVRPRVEKYYPYMVNGAVQTAMKEYGFELAIPVAAPIVSVNPSARYSFIGPREGQRLVHGVLEDDNETYVEWSVCENNITKDGIPRICNVAIIISYTAGRDFTMGLNIRATTLAGIPVVGRGGGLITFSPAGGVGSSPATVMENLNSGVVQCGQADFVSSQSQAAASNQDTDLHSLDLETLTDMRKLLAGDISVSWCRTCLTKCCT